MINIVKENDKQKNYQLMVNVIETMIEDENDIIANFSNISSIINAYMDEVNWVGFYMLKNGVLVLGPFQGMPACIRIKVGKGVCGKAAEERKTIIVNNVHEFEGHIACDSNTNSEIVIPIFKDNEVYAVLDVDSPKINRFSEVEKIYLTQVVELINKFLENCK